MKSAKFDLTSGPIMHKLLTLSVPIMATAFMQTAHNMTNMFWLGRLGDEYVAAAGVAGQFMWLSMAFIFLCRIGAEIGVSQNMGKGDPETAKAYAQNGFMLSLGVGILYALVIFVFRSQFIDFYNIDDPYVASIAEHYLAIIALSFPFIFTHLVITSVYNGCGNAKLPFYINSAGLLLNVILSPILIFVLGWGITGAAISMVVAAVFNFILKIWAMTLYKNRPFEKYAPFVLISKDKAVQILKWGVPVGAESMLFTLLYMIVTRFVSDFGGDGAIAAQNIGLQVESLSFMIGGGFASALTAFIGQNYGAKKWRRLRKTHRIASIFMAAYGTIVAFIMFVFAEPLVSIFLTDPDSIRIGGDYLRIIALAQILFSLESVALGSFRGRGLTRIPATAGITSNILRVIIAFFLARAFGVNGIWAAIAISMTIRSVWLLVWHKLDFKKVPKIDEMIATNP
ncbi:MAG: MATE family efflux transporter [Defluviitaleaceae bacterium]|nr:MATE family efflux transporter [Defluviitaleaceae bacterium]